MKSTQLISPRTLARLRAALHRLDIPHTRVAAEAGVSKHMVSHVLAGRAKSARVVGVMKRLIADAKATVAA